MPKKNKNPINVVPLQSVKPSNAEDEPKVNEPKIEALEDLSEADNDDTADSPYVDMANAHRENIQIMLDETKKEDLKIIGLMNYG